MDCHDCFYCYDNEEALHFYRCNVHYLCVDCQPLYCKGFDFKLKNLLGDKNE